MLLSPQFLRCSLNGNLEEWNGGGRDRDEGNLKGQSSLPQPSHLINWHILCLQSQPPTTPHLMANPLAKSNSVPQADPILHVLCRSLVSSVWTALHSPLCLGNFYSSFKIHCEFSGVLTFSYIAQMELISNFTTPLSFFYVSVPCPCSVMALKAWSFNYLLICLIQPLDSRWQNCIQFIFWFPRALFIFW